MYFEVVACENLMGLPIVKRSAIVWSNNQKNAVKKFQRHYDDYGHDEYRARKISETALELLINDNMIRRYFYRNGKRHGHFDYDYID